MPQQQDALVVAVKHSEELLGPQQQAKKAEEGNALTKQLTAIVMWRN
ncbi:MAG: hypothetical protein ACKVHR_15770 [Pirellulales bacterium]